LAQGHRPACCSTVTAGDRRADVVGLADKGVGFAKELLGELFDREALRQSGQLQQEKGTARLSALKAELTAEAQNAKVQSLDKAQQKAADVS